MTNGIVQDDNAMMGINILLLGYLKGEQVHIF
jgi:hypothetical protein